MPLDTKSKTQHKVDEDWDIFCNGERVQNEGQFVLNLDADTGQEFPRALACTFQVADLKKPLMSVSQLCEQGFQCVFKDTHALVVDTSGETVCRF